MITVHVIDQLVDFQGLKEYAYENKYTTIRETSPAIKRLEDSECVNYLEFEFDVHERFAVTLQNQAAQQEACDWLRNYIPEQENEEDLIFGKDRTNRIVSCEAIDTGCEIFIEEEDGSIKSIIRPNEFWLLSYQRHDQSWKKLKGERYYRYVKRYTNKEEWMDERRVLKKKTFSVWDDKEAMMLSQGFTYFKGMKIDEVSILSFDIETTTLEHSGASKVLLISNTYRQGKKKIKKLFSFDEYETQGQMIDAWCKWVRDVNPSIMVGHNIFTFDLCYLSFVASKEGTSLRLGRDGSDIRFNEYESKFRKDGSQFYLYKKAYVYGRELIDTLFLSYKYDIGRKYDSNGLKKIIQHEYEDGVANLAVGKSVSNNIKEMIERQKSRVFYDANKIKENYRNPEEFEKIKHYCEGDSDDSLTLFDLMAPSFFYLNRSVPKSFQEIVCSATGSQINCLMIRGYLQYGKSIPRESTPEEYEGAISFGKPGLYKNLFKLDISSLYPSIIIQYDLYDRFKDPSGNFLTMAKYFTKERLENKRLAKETGLQYYKDLEQSEKQVINSFYGFCAAPGLLFNSPQIASFITKKGRDILTFCLNWATGKVPDGQRFENA